MIRERLRHAGRVLMIALWPEKRERDLSWLEIKQLYDLSWLHRRQAKRALKLSQKLNDEALALDEAYRRRLEKKRAGRGEA